MRLVEGGRSCSATRCTETMLGMFRGRVGRDRGGRCRLVSGVGDNLVDELGILAEPCAGSGFNHADVSVQFGVLLGLVWVINTISRSGRCKWRRDNL